MRSAVHNPPPVFSMQKVVSDGGSRDSYRIAALLYVLYTRIYYDRRAPIRCSLRDTFSLAKSSRPRVNTAVWVGRPVLAHRTSV